jgi:hypothetical protein
VETIKEKSARQRHVEEFLLSAWNEVGPAGCVVPPEYLAKKGAESYIRAGNYYDPYLHAAQIGTWSSVTAMAASTYLRHRIEPFRYPK